MLLLLPLLAACTPAPKVGYDAWPEPTEVYPWVYTPEADLEPYEEVRWETETWDPGSDTEQVGFYLFKALNHRKGAPEESLEHFSIMRDTLPPVSTGADDVSLSFVGDVMWMGENWSTFALPAAGLLDGDLRIGNLETPTDPGRATEPSDLGLYTFNAPPEMLDGLPLDVLQLNNNHSLDVEDAGLEATIAEVEARGFLHTGIDGRGAFTSSGGGVGFLSYTWGVNRRDITSAHDLNIIPFGHLDGEPDLTSLGEDIAFAKENGLGSVVVLVHWGFEYEYYPDPHFMQIGRRIVALGADLVVGEGPHVAQPAEICHVNNPAVIPGIGTCSVRTEDGEPRTAAILYSLGNFGTTMPTVPCQTGIVATVTLDPDVTGLGWAGAITVDGEQGLEVVPLEGALDDLERAAESERLDAHLGVGWKR
ncbi:MAG: CapA family protein [Pseudomonadota bacterium]|nr:CapA family protein [Pseudomonadota bacterium]